MDWRPVAAGDFVFVPPGTVHAIGAGISLLELQQNSDVTYRLYDYGRPRELHLDDGVAVSNPAPFPAALVQHLSGTDRRTLAEDEHFIIRQDRKDAFEDRLRWVIPLSDEVRAGGTIGRPGDCLVLQPGERMEASNATLLIGASTSGR